MKKIFVLFLSLILCLPMSFTPVYAEEASHDFYDDLTSYDDLYQEDDLIIFLDDLLDEDIIAESERMIIERRGQAAWTNYASAFPASQKLINMFPRDRLGNTMYPYDFGGMYFNDDGMLVVQVVKDSSTINNADHFTRILPEYVIIEKVQLSHNYLHEIQDIFTAFIAEYDLDPLTRYIYGWGQGVENQVTVLIQYNEESLSSFAYIVEYLGLNPEYFNLEFVFGDPAPCIRIFAPPEDYDIDLYVEEIWEEDLEIGIVPYSGLLNPGDRIYRDRIGQNGRSVGFRARRNNANGFITSGHGIQDNQIFVNSSGNRIGIVERATVSGMTDAAFIRLDSGASATNTIHYNTGSRSLSVGVMDSRVGLTIAVVGSVTGISTGEVTNLNWLHRVSGFPTVTGVRTNITRTRGGDSGGLVYHVDPQTRVLHTIGVNMGSCPDGHQVYVTARSVNLSLQTSRH